MKNHVKKVAAAFGLLAVLTTATAMAIGPWSNAVMISGIELDPNPAAGAYGSLTYLSFTSTPTGIPSTCNTSGYFLLVGPPDHLKAMTAMATSAMLAGRTVKLYWNGCTGPYPNIYLISMQ
jgi:hypothetical protein